MAKVALHDDLTEALEPVETTEEAVVALLISVADRLEASRGNDGVLRAYVKSLRDGTDGVTNALLAKLPARAKK